MSDTTGVALSADGELAGLVQKQSQRQALSRLSAVLGLSLVLGFGCGQAGGSIDIIVLYPGTSGLEVGGELRMSGFAVGEVTELELEPDGRVGVRIRMEPEYSTYVTEGSKFALKREDLAPNTRYIELDPGPGEPVADETRFEGGVSWADRLHDMTWELLDSVGETEFKKHLEELTAAAEQAAEQGWEEWESRRPELEAEGRHLLEQLEKEGGEAAETLRKKLEKYLEEMEQTEDEPGSGSTQI